MLRLGLLLMGSGTSGYRVIRGMKRAGRALGFDRLDVIVSVNTITCTFHRGHHFRTIVATQNNPAVDASRIEALDNLTHHMHRRITVAELNGWLDDIEENVRGRWAPWLLMLAAGAACFGFAILNRYTLGEAAVVFFAACIGQLVRITLTRRHLVQLGVVSLSAVAASVSYFALMTLLPTQEIQVGFVASLLFLVPGFPLYSSLLDLARFDIPAGASRLIYALSIITAATIAASIVSAITGLEPLGEVRAQLPLWAAAIASAMGIAGFALIFNSSRRMLVVATVIGTVANLVRFQLMELGMRPQFAAFCAGLLIGLIAAVVSKRARLPRITTTVPAAVIMVPGAAMYQAMYFVNIGEIDQFLNNAAAAALIVLSIGAGLALARMLTDRDWAFGHFIDFSKPLSASEAQGQPSHSPWVS